jgi:N-methylhydantoinase A
VAGHALTATCAAHALGLVDGPAEAALAGFAALGARMRCDAREAARRLLEPAVDKIARAVADAARAHDFGPDVPVVALGGAGAALAPAVAERLGRPVLRPEHPEILSSIGAALSLVRAEAVRHGGDAGAMVALAHEAELACVAQGAAPHTVRVETAYEARGGLLRAVATGAVALESGAAGRDPVGEPAQLRAAATALGMAEDALAVVARNDFYRVFCENGRGHVAVVDGLGSVALAEHADHVLTGPGSEVLERLHGAVEDSTVNLGVASLLPRVALVCGPRIVDLSDAKRVDELLGTARTVLERHDGEAVALVWS